MTSHYTGRSVTTLHDFGGVLGQPLDTFFWALTMSWSQLLAPLLQCHSYSFFLLQFSTQPRSLESYCSDFASSPNQPQEQSEESKAKGGVLIVLY